MADPPSPVVDASSLGLSRPVAAAAMALAGSLSSARLSTSLQTAHAEYLASSLTGLHTSRTGRQRKTPRAAHTNLALEEKCATSLAPKAQLAQALSAQPALPAHSAPHIEVNTRRAGTYHHLPPMTDAERTILFDALPTLRQMDDVPAHSLELRSASLSIVRQWLQDKLSASKWTQLIQSIKVMAEGSEHTNIHARHTTLKAMGMDARTLHSTGIPPPLVHRIYKSLWVYSLGMHELVTEVAHHAKNSHQVIGAMWKCYAILLEDYRGDDYVMALLQIEAESQRVLKLMEERFSKSLQLKQENEVKTQTEVKTLSSLLERSQTESRTLLEKKESLLHEILHLETLNQDLETMHQESKKELWRTSNTLNRVTGKYDQLVKSSKLHEEKLLQDIHELKLEQEEVKASLDQELSTNERLSYKVDRFTSAIADLTANTTRLKTELNEKMHEANLVNKVLEKTTLELSNAEREKVEQELDLQVRLVEASHRVKEAEAKIRDMEEAERARLEREVEEREREELLSRAVVHDTAAGDPVTTSPLVLDLHAQLAAAHLKHNKELTEMRNRSGVMSDRIRALQKKVRDLGGGPRFARKKEGDSDEDYVEATESVYSPPMSPRKLQQSVADQLRGGTTSRSRRRDDDEEGSGDSTSSSKSNSRRNSRTRSSLGKPKVSVGSLDELSLSLQHKLPPHRSPSASGRARSLSTASPTDPKAIFQYPGTSTSLAIEFSQLQSDLESKEKLNTNLLVNINKLKVSLNQQTEETRKKDEVLSRTRVDLAATKDQLREEQHSRAAHQKKCTELSAEVDRLSKVEKTCTDQSRTIQDLTKAKIHTLTENTELSAAIVERTKQSKALAKEVKASKATIAKLRDDVKDLQSECDNRSKNQNELGLRIRTLNMELMSLQSLNDEIQRNIRSTADNSSLLGSLETKNNEINRLFLKIRAMEHEKIAALKQHETKLLEAKHKAEADGQKKLDDALSVEQARAKKLRAQITDQKGEFTHTIEELRSEGTKRTAEVDLARQTSSKVTKENERLQAALDDAHRKLEQQLAIERRLTDREAMAALQDAAHGTVAAATASKPKTPPIARTTSNSSPATSTVSPAVGAGLLTSELPTGTFGLDALNSSDDPVPSPSPPPSLLSPALADLGVDELTSLLTGATPVNPHTLAAALKDVSVKLALSVASVRDGKEVREQLEEANFMGRNQILILQEQIDSLKTKYRDVAARLAATDASATAAGSSHAGGGGAAARKRKNKKSLNSSNTLILSDDPDLSSSSDEDTARRGARITRVNFATASKRGSTGKSQSVDAQASAGPPMLARSHSISKIKVDATKANAATGKSPRSTLTRSSTMVSPSSIPALKRTTSMDLGAEGGMAALAASAVHAAAVGDEGEDEVHTPKIKSPPSSRRQLALAAPSAEHPLQQPSPPPSGSPVVKADAIAESLKRKPQRRTKPSETDAIKTEDDALSPSEGAMGFTIDISSLGPEEVTPADRSPVALASGSSAPHSPRNRINSLEAGRARSRSLNVEAEDSASASAAAATLLLPAPALRLPTQSKVAVRDKAREVLTARDNKVKSSGEEGDLARLRDRPKELTERRERKGPLGGSPAALAPTPITSRLDLAPVPALTLGLAVVQASPPPSSAPPKPTPTSAQARREGNLKPAPAAAATTTATATHAPLPPSSGHPAVASHTSSLSSVPSASSSPARSGALAASSSSIVLGAAVSGALLSPVAAMAALHHLRAKVDNSQRASDTDTRARTTQNSHA